MLEDYVALYRSLYIMYKNDPHLDIEYSDTNTEANRKAMNDVVIQYAKDKRLNWASLEVNNFIHEMYKDRRFKKN